MKCSPHDRRRARLVCGVLLAAIGAAACGRTASPPRPAVTATPPSRVPANIRDVEFLAFPRIVAVAEIGWSPAERRGWESFRERLGAHRPRWTALGVNFYRSPQVPWKN